jgi:hypothetical protein
MTPDMKPTHFSPAGAGEPLCRALVSPELGLKVIALAPLGLVVAIVAGGWAAVGTR